MAGLGIRIADFSEARRQSRQKNVIYGARYAKRLWHGDEANAMTTFRAIQTMDPTRFEDFIIWGVYRFVVAYWADVPRLEAVRWFAGVDINQIEKRATAIIRGGKQQLGNLPECISYLLAEQYLTETKK
jgi:hypothetical protein